MRHLCRLLAMAGTVLFCQGAWALGLDTPLVFSHLNEPVKARIPLRDTQGMQAGDIKVSLPDEKVFDAAGIKRSAATDTLSLRVVKSGNGFYVALDGTRPQREPYLQLVLDVAWPDGYLQRQITLLLDPPGVPASAQATSADAAALPQPMTSPPRKRNSEPQHQAAAHDVSVAKETSVAKEAKAATATSSDASATAVAALGQRLDALQTRLDTLVGSRDDEATLSALQTKLDALTQTQQGLAKRLDELAQHQQALTRQLNSDNAAGKGQAALPANAEKSAGGLWHDIASWLSPFMLFTIGGLLVVLGLLLMLRHQHAKEDEGALIDFDSNDDLDNNVVPQSRAEMAHDRKSEVAPLFPLSERSTSASDAAAGQETPRQPTDASHGDANNSNNDSIHPLSAGEAINDAAMSEGGEDIGARDDYLSEDDVDIFIAHGRFEQARELLEGELERAPDNTSARGKLMEVLARLGQTEAVQQHKDYLAAHRDMIDNQAETAQDKEGDAPLALSGSEYELEQLPANTIPITYESLPAAGESDGHDTESESSRELSFSRLFDDGFEPVSTMTVGETSRIPPVSDPVQLASNPGTSLFSANWPLEEVAFETLDRDNDSPVDETAHDERLTRAQALLEADETDQASALLHQVVEEGPAPSREAARTLIERFKLHTN